RVGGELAQEEAAVAVSPLHHRGDGYPAISEDAALLDGTACRSCVFHSWRFCGTGGRRIEDVQRAPGAQSTSPSRPHVVSRLAAGRLEPVTDRKPGLRHPCRSALCAPPKVVAHPTRPRDAGGASMCSG